MKNFRFFAVCAVLLSALFAGSCGGVYGDYKSFNSDLQGTWVSNEQGLYSGKLTIDFDTITIEGYEENYWATVLGNDNQCPFKEYPKKVPLKGYSEGVPLNGYSEEGEIFIDYGSAAQNGIPYYYYETVVYPKKYKILEFTFGGKKERLECQVNY
jgi:hypothetical protein